MTHRSASPASSAASSSSSTACSWKESSHPESWQKQNVRTQRVLDVRRAKNPAVDGLKLDCLRATLSATRIVARDTKECLYSITVDANACSPTTTGLHRGPVLDNQSRRLASSPFATLKGKSIYINDKNQPKSSSVTKVKRRDFLYSSGFFGQ